MSRRRKWLIATAGLAIVVVFVALRGPRIPDGSYLVVELEGQYAEGARPGLIGRLLGERRSLVSLLGNLEKAAYDRRLSGIIVRVGDLETGWARAAEIRDRLRDARVRGKRVLALLRGDHLGGNLEYYVASAAEEVHVSRSSTLMLNGLSANFMFLGGVWEKIDVALEVERRGEYKTAADTLVGRTMSAAHREMANSILDSVNAEFTTALATGRALPAGEIEAIIDASPASPEALIEAGLADGLSSMDELLSGLRTGGRPAPTVTETTYGRVSRKQVGLGGGGKVAVIHIDGTIVSGPGRRGPGPGMSVGSGPTALLLEATAADPSTAAIVLRIDSPGGSAQASDELWTAIRTAAIEKPVVASLGDVAASGGYYLASAADLVVAEPATLTGSIGVVLFKPNIAGLLGRLGIGSETLGRGRYSRIMDVTKGLDRAERSLLSTQMERVYELFLDRVAEGRSMTVEEVGRLARGRVWTGRQALEIGLVDRLGGLQTAVQAAARRAGLDDPGQLEVEHLPHPAGPLAELLAMRDQTYEVPVVRLPATVSRMLGSALGLAAVLEPGILALAVTVPVIN